MSSAEILEQFRRDHARDNATDINLTLRQPYLDLLRDLGNPHHHCPPVLHIAGTNGKGSTCAFLRSILEAAGYKVHVYTSPHLVTFHERIRLAGQLISETYLVELLSECARISAPGSISYFEAATAVAFAAFARTKADFTILETGLGGRLDATNVVEKPLATLITRLSYDHREYLGSTLEQIAREKAGIMRPRIPCFVGPQPSPDGLKVLSEIARSLEAPLSVGGIDWQVSPAPQGFLYREPGRELSLPSPALVGSHQWKNAGLAIAALAALPFPPAVDFIKEGLRRVDWPGRLQNLNQSRLIQLLPPGTDLWLDGGHNDSAGEVLADQARAWHDEKKSPRALHIIMGMLSTKSPREFLSPLLPFIESVTTLSIPHEPLSLTASDLAHQIKNIGVKKVFEASNLTEALKNIPHDTHSNRVLICGSLYLAGHVLACN